MFFDKIPVIDFFVGPGGFLSCAVAFREQKILLKGGTTGFGKNLRIDFLKPFMMNMPGARAESTK
jgi:hypothetical protein